MRPRYILLVFGFAMVAAGQRSPVATPANREVVQQSLVAPGSPPFHLVAKIAKGSAAEPYGDVELFWVAPDRYRRVIHAADFSQTLVITAEGTSELDEPAYFPLTLRTLVTAMVDPAPILAAVRDGDRVATKANGGASESGLTCLDPNKVHCFVDPAGFREIVAASGHSIDYSHYEKFHGRRVARTISNAPRLGEERVTLQITTLESLPKPDEGMFTMAEATAPQDQLHFVTLPNNDLRKSAPAEARIIWPQALDGAERGPASFYVSFDTTGTVREVRQLYTVNERTNESAINQIRRWSFTPVTENGLPAQGEGVLALSVDTRAFGPKEPLTDTEARALATGIVEAELPAGKLPSGTRYTVYAAIDADGHVIEMMPAADSPGGYFIPCMQALQKWRFLPVMVDGEPMPYRALINFFFP